MKQKDKKFAAMDDAPNEQDIDMDERLMKSVAKAILEDELRACNEAYEKYKDVDFEEDMEERLQAIFDKHDEIEKKRNFTRKTKKIAKIAAVIVLALGVFGTAGYFSTTEAFRAELLNLIFKTHDRYDEIVVDDSREQPADSEEENNNGEVSDHFVLQLDYVPEGYELVQNDADNLQYEDIKNKNKYIRLYCRHNDDAPYADNEKSSIERIYRNGYEVELRYTETVMFAMWQDREQYFSLAATYTDRETFIKIIEGIEWVE